MKVWLQHSDFTEEEFDLDLSSTLRMLEDTDWLAELAELEKLARNDEEHCLPGLGIDHPENRILHVCPNPSGAMVHYHYPKKVMGLFNTQNSRTFENVHQEQVVKFVRAIFYEDWAAIENYA